MIPKAHSSSRCLTGDHRHHTALEGLNGHALGHLRWLQMHFRRRIVFIEAETLGEQHVQTRWSGDVLQCNSTRSAQRWYTMTTLLDTTQHPMLAMMVIHLTAYLGTRLDQAGHGGFQQRV